jgi:Na+-translocating ferredoxin:NAD+ oxidoreductase subunit D
MGTLTEQPKVTEQTDVQAAPASKFISVSPHIKGKYSTSGIMWAVNLSLAPATLLGAYYFGLRGIMTLFLCITSSVVSEYVYQKLMKQKITISDGSAFLTGLLLAMNLPPSVPFYIPVLGSVVAIVLTKQLFGGLGFNLFNPALMARVFLMVSFPKILTTWNEPVRSFVKNFDAATSATPLGMLKLDGYQSLIQHFGSKAQMYSDLLIGNRGGCIGETAIIALLAGGLFLLFTRIISWHIPVAYLGTAAIMAFIFGGKGAFFTGDPLLHLLSGGIVLGAFFMATDYVTSPMSSRGKLVFGLGCGFLTMLIRLKGGYPEGVMFSILIMNCFAPLIDRAFKPKVFGSAVKRSAA